MRINDVVFDEDAKELVRISNMRCTLSHDPNGFAAAHEGGMASCVYEPSEAVALRVVGFAPGGRAVTAFTYRKVRASALHDSVTVASKELFESFNTLKGGKYFIGRV